MKIYLIDCDSISRTELTGMIEAEELGEVSGVSAGWDDACRRIPGIRPDVILADLPLPELKVITCIRRIMDHIEAFINNFALDHAVPGPRYGNGTEGV